MRDREGKGEAMTFTKCECFEFHTLCSVNPAPPRAGSRKSKQPHSETIGLRYFTMFVLPYLQRNWIIFARLSWLQWYNTQVEQMVCVIYLVSESLYLLAGVCCTAIETHTDHTCQSGSFCFLLFKFPSLSLMDYIPHTSQSHTRTTHHTHSATSAARRLT